jgi:hypothetical protein
MMGLDIGWVLAGLLAAHVCGDILAYSRFVSGMKRAERAASRVLATSVHCLVHAVLVFLFLWAVPMATRLYAALYVFGVHFLIDLIRVALERNFYPPEDRVILSKKDIMRMLAGRARKPVHGFLPQNKKAWLGMNLVDQGLHLVALLVFAFGIFPHLS